MKIAYLTVGSLKTRNLVGGWWSQEIYVYIVYLYKIIVYYLYITCFSGWWFGT